MDTYLKNLTDHLINKHRFTPETHGRLFVGNFAKTVADILYDREVRKMNPETLGKIMCAIPVQGVALYLMSNVSGKDALRTHVAGSLARVIEHRLCPRSDRRTWPAYKA